MSVPIYIRPRTDRERLLVVIQLAEARGWQQTLERAQHQLYLLETGKIDRAF